MESTKKTPSRGASASASASARAPAMRFVNHNAPRTGTLAVPAFIAKDSSKGKKSGATLVWPEGVAPELVRHVAEVAKAAGFKGGRGATLDVWSPPGGLDRVVLVGMGAQAKLKPLDWEDFGGIMAVRVGAGGSVLTLSVADGDPAAGARAMAGIRLGGYRFDRRKSAPKPVPAWESIHVSVANTKAAQTTLATLNAGVDGALAARDLVNEPPNHLGPEEFVANVRALFRGTGATIKVHDEAQMRKLGMGALLGVAQGSARPPRLLTIIWNGGAARAKPIALVGKGVVFDSGGLSLKPAGGMEDMKGDMGGAAAVTGAMLALTKRKAKINAVGVLGLVENMPSGTAQRPSDIVTAMSGTTIEVLNTDAEGRLVLADALHYVLSQYKPRAVIDVATLTGAIVVALGKAYAGLFANDDGLAEALTRAGDDVGERLWRMPMTHSYDKMIDSKVADIKNIGGGREAGSSTAAHFLARFVDKNIPWAHLDIAGVGMGAPPGPTRPSWASGFGARLLDRLCAQAYE